MQRFICLAILLATSATAQDAAPATIALQTKSVTIGILALDKHGKPLRSLPKEELAVEVDGHPAHVVSVEPAADSPFVYAILLDCSGSTRDKLDPIRQDTLDIVKLVANGKNHGGLILFSSQGRLVVDVTTVDSAQKAVTESYPYGGTPLYDTIEIASEGLAKLAHPGQRKVLFIVTDGEDNASRLSLDVALDRVTADGVTVFALGLIGKDREAGRAKKALRKLADETGGVVFLTTAPTESFVAEFQQRLAAALNVTFSTAVPADGKDHPIRVYTSRQDARVLAPTHYILAP